MIGSCVVDASVAIKLFVVEDLSDQADRLFKGLAEDPPARFYIPDLFYGECANVLWKYVRHHGYPAENARQDVVDLKALALASVSTANLLEAALELAITYDITVYDASYAALAQQLDLPLVTADVPLARRLVGSGVDVHMLHELRQIAEA
jgi:predicted nucleic acid-binding protein